VTDSVRVHSAITHGCSTTTLEIVTGRIGLVRERWMEGQRPSDVVAAASVREMTRRALAKRHPSISTIPNVAANL
jgi:hypothetical protein